MHHQLLTSYRVAQDCWRLEPGPSNYVSFLIRCLLEIALLLYLLNSSRYLWAQENGWSKKDLQPHFIS